MNDMASQTPRLFTRSLQYQVALKIDPSDTRNPVAPLLPPGCRVTYEGLQYFLEHVIQNFASQHTALVLRFILSNVSDFSGIRTEIEFIARAACAHSNLEVLQELASHGLVDIDESTECENHVFSMNLHMSIIHDKLEVTKWLLEREAQLHSRTLQYPQYTISWLEVAMRRLHDVKSVPTIEFLLNMGLAMDDMSTILAVNDGAAMHVASPIMKRLLCLGLDENLMLPSGANPLNLLIDLWKNGRPVPWAPGKCRYIAWKLVMCGVDPDAVDGSGLSPRKNAREENCEWLLGFIYSRQMKAIKGTVNIHS